MATKDAANPTPFPAGDVTRGFATFEKLHCTSCHQVAGYDFPESRPSLRPPMVLGEGSSRNLPPWELSEAIIDPSHSLAPDFDSAAFDTGDTSIMPNYSHVMTVRELVDLVAFLGDAYSPAGSR